MEQSNQSKKVLLSVIGVAILVVAVVGVSFAFFNYTQTGAANTVSTGKIKFNSNVTASEPAGINLQNMFPITTSVYATEALSDGVPVATVPNNAHFGRYVVTLSGETTYADGIDFRITAQAVNLNAGGKTLPINVAVYKTDNANTSLGDTAITVTQYTSTTVATGNELASGHIGQTVESTTEPVVTFDGTRYSATVTIDVYLDGSRILITDTPANNTELQGDRTVLSTTEWNSMASSPVSFKVRVEAKDHTTAGEYVAATNYSA